MNALPQNLPVNVKNHKFKDPTEVAKLKNPQEPIQCFSANKLKQRIDLFQNSFPGDVSYAVKANPSLLIIKAAALAGLKTFDVASPAEMDLVSQYANGAVMHYHNPIRATHEIEQAWHKHQCRRYSIDEASELRKILKIIGNPARIEIAVRFRLPSSGHAVHDFSEKFGATQQAASQLLAQVKLCGFIPVLTFHPGSQCLDPASWREHIIAASDIAKTAGVTIAKLNVGGGFPVDYAAHQAPDLKLFFKTIQDATNQAFGPENTPALECEPGRAIVAPSVSVLTRVKMVRKATQEVYLNDGIYGNLMESTQAPDLRPVARIVSGKNTITPPQSPFIVYGPTCDPLDRLPGTIMLPTNIAEDDFVEFRNLGAYGMATSTNFNGYGISKIVEVTTL